MGSPPTEKTGEPAVLSGNWPSLGRYHVPMPTQIEIYEEMSALSTHMVEAAHAHDWERLVGLEKSVAALRSKLPKEEDNAALSSAELNHKRELIQGILENDADVRACTEPWMEQLRKFLGNNTRRKRMKTAYSAEG